MQASNIATASAPVDGGVVVVVVGTVVTDASVVGAEQARTNRKKVLATNRRIGVEPRL
jgi:hypothetical protein